MSTQPAITSIRPEITVSNSSWEDALYSALREQHYGKMLIRLDLLPDGTAFAAFYICEAQALNEYAAFIKVLPRSASST